jgi:hypothetical protein
VCESCYLRNIIKNRYSCPNKELKLRKNYDIQLMQQEYIDEREIERLRMARAYLDDRDWLNLLFGG